MDAHVNRTKAEQGYVGQFEAGRERLPGGEWAQTLRETAFDRFTVGGLPHRRIEEWKYTDLRARLTEALPPAPPVAAPLDREAVDAALGAFGSIDCIRLVLVDGVFHAELSDVDALRGKGDFMALSEALESPPDWVKTHLGSVNPQEREAIVSLNMALASDGIAWRVDDDCVFDRPIHVVHLHAAATEAGLATRNLISVGSGASLTLLESFVTSSKATAQRNTVTELVVGDNARVEHIKFQNEGLDAVHLSSWLTRLGKDAIYSAFQFSIGAGLARNQIFVTFAGEGGVSHVSSAVMARDDQHNDTTLVIDHAVPGCESRELNKVVLDDEARGIVQCKVNVHRDAQKSDGHQMAHGLLLSDGAEFNSKPELEIFADDVVCGHGSTSGKVDENLMFYLRSRGIPEAEARALLILAFTGDAIEKVENEAIRDAFSVSAEAWLTSTPTSDNG